MKKSKRIFITGNVQPVLFNAYIKENADNLGIRGFVRTLEDKRIEIFIEGHIDAVEKMTAICKRGSEHSMIRNVEERDSNFQGFGEFKILRI